MTNESQQFQRAAIKPGSLTGNGPAKTKDYREILKTLSPEKRALLELGLKKQSEGAGVLESIPALSRAGETNPFPLSYAQERLWFLDQLRPGHIGYRATFGLGIKGKLDVGILQRS